MTELTDTEYLERVIQGQRRKDPGWYGVATPPGWNNIVRRLDEDLFAMIGDYELYQAKEKFAKLRYYCQGDGRPEVRARIREAEKESAETCMSCGADKARLINSGGWLGTYCEDHTPEGATEVNLD